MTVSKRLVLAVGRHTGTEAGGTGAAAGTRFLFASMEESLRRHFTLVPIPPYYYSGDSRRALRVAIDVLARVDACIFGLPPSPFDLDPFFVVRERMGKRTPFVYMPLGEFPRGAWYYRNIHRHLRAGDLILFSSHADKAIHDALVTSTPARTLVAPFGIRPRLFRVSPEQRQRTRRHFALNRDDVVFVYHGRVTEEKNVHGALMTFCRVARSSTRSRLWIVGETPGHREIGPQPLERLSSNRLTRAFRALLRGHVAEDRVLFWGDVAPAALPAILGAADVAVNFTLNGDENFGYGVVEAMAAGLPVLGTDWGGLKDTIEEGVTGFRVPTFITATGVALDQWTAWQRAQTLVDDTAQRKRMGAAGQASAMRRFDLERFAELLAHEIRMQLAERDSPAPAPAPASAAVPATVSHVWSPLGKRLSAQYSRAVAGQPTRAIPTRIPVTPALFSQYPLMREVVGPYATERCRERPMRDAMFFLATDLVSVRSGAISSRDPRYLFEVKGAASVDVAVIRQLKAQGFCDFASLSRDGRLLRATSSARYAACCERGSCFSLVVAIVLPSQESAAMTEPRDREAALAFVNKWYPCTCLLLGERSDVALEQFCHETSTGNVEGAVDVERWLACVHAEVAREQGLPAYTEDVATYEGAIAALTLNDDATVDAATISERNAGVGEIAPELHRRLVPVPGGHVRVERFSFNAPGIVMAIEECDRLEGKDEPEPCAVLLLKKSAEARPQVVMVSEAVCSLLALCDGRRSCAEIAAALWTPAANEEAKVFELRVLNALEQLRARNVLSYREPDTGREP